MWKKLREKQRNRQECTTAAAVVRILGGKFLEVHIVRVMVEAESEEVCRKYVNSVVDVIKEKGFAL